MNSFSRINIRNTAIKNLSDVLSLLNKVLIIHYSCESFYELSDGRSARITSIGIRYLDTGQNKSFSIHRVAELKKIKISEIENHYNILEKELLDDFFDFVDKHKDFYWIHWNMRDVSFGFEALKHRYEVLGGKPVNINNYHRINLAKLIKEKYGEDYIEHPRLEKLVEKNNITKKDFLSGEDEAQAFNNKHFVELHKSTLRKVEIINIVLVKTMDNSLKHNSNIKNIYGFSSSGIREFYKENIWITIIIWFFGVVIGCIIQKYLL